ncbi:MAG: GYD domain-containing protein [Candidatus Solibacter sp.]
MPKYLQQFSYTAEGLKGLLKDSGSKRRAAIAETVKSAGGKLETLYFAFGEFDAYAIIEAPDNSSAAAVALAANAGGAVRLKTTVLLTPEEVDQATKKSVSYRPPGG